VRGPRRPGRDRWLPVRIGLYFVAAAFLLASEVADRRVYAIPAVVVALAALLMRFLPRGPDDADDADDPRDEPPEA
jgi:hypothetical protein